MFSKIRSLIFKLDPEKAHDLAIKALKLNLVSQNKIKNNKSIKFNTRIGLLITSIIALVICISFNKVIDIWYVFGSIGASSLLIPLIKIIFNPNYRIAYPALTLIIPGVFSSFILYAI